ncbi:MAG: hypothetical protein U1E10_03395 [Bdellovibrionales bacterium]|nr:hypothetical protein [Bdellovibrionales bacterium]
MKPTHISTALLWAPILSAALSIGCGNTFQASSQQPSKSESSTDQPPFPPPPPPQQTFELPKIQWEAKDGARSWSLHAFKTVLAKAPHLLEGADDVTEYCPRFFAISIEERAWFWTALVSGMAFYESGWDPTSRMHETTMGTDPVTGQPLYSEGLLQLSYQDRQGHPYCNEFDWDNDRHLGPRDPRKTILNPEKNLSCGIQILNRQIRKHRRIGIGKGAYWSVIKITKPKNKIEKIKERLKSVAPCFSTKAPQSVARLHPSFET